MERIVLTMPITPYSKFSIGKMTTPILAETLAKKMNALFILSVNLLDSYKERNLEEYLELLNKYQIKPDYLWIDKAYINELLDKIYYLIDNNYIYKKEESILNCRCKKVEISINNLDTINLTDANFTIKEGKYYCKYCCEECCIKNNDVLVFNPNLIDNKQLFFYPEFINKDIKTFYNTVGKNEIVITRERNTGITIDYNQKKYNLDIDFLWQVYLALFPNAEKIILCSNHQLYQLFMVSLLEKCFNNQGKTIAIATPYLNIPNNSINKELQERIISLKLFALLNQKWSRKENSCDEALLKYINTMNIEKKQELYELILTQTENNDLEQSLKLILTKEINRQNLNQELKRRRKKNV